MGNITLRTIFQPDNDSWYDLFTVNIKMKLFFVIRYSMNKLGIKFVSISFTKWHSLKMKNHSNSSDLELYDMLKIMFIVYSSSMSF